MKSYRSLNDSKARFDGAYCSPTPHAYFHEMDNLEYAIGQEAQPYFHALIHWMRRKLGPQQSIRMLDRGCSYGVGSALVKYGFSFSEIADFFDSQKSQDYKLCVEDTREWLADNEPIEPISCIGADSSAEAIRFAKDADLIDGAIACNLEKDQDLSEKDRGLIRQCNLLTSTGAIGYVGEETLSAILTHLGKDRAGLEPYAAVTILRMFPAEPIAKAFAHFGYQFAIVPGVQLRQRRFHDDEEQCETVRILHERGLDTDGLESEGYRYADLYVAARAKDVDFIVTQMEETRLRLETEVATGA